MKVGGILMGCRGAVRIPRFEMAEEAGGFHGSIASGSSIQPHDGVAVLCPLCLPADFLSDCASVLEGIGLIDGLARAPFALHVFRQCRSPGHLYFSLLCTPNNIWLTCPALDWYPPLHSPHATPPQ